MSAKKYFLISSLIIIITSICGPAMAATQAQINGAINNGVAWLVTQQDPTGYWHGDSEDGDFPAAGTGLALIKLEERAFELGYNTPFDPCYPYKQNVEKGLAYLFSQMSIIHISPQPAGNPDTNGDGNGVYVNQFPTYETGIAMMAIAASRTPNREVNSPGSPVNGWTYKKVLQNMVDYMAFGQCDSDNGRGGWTYSYYNNSGGSSDNSNSGYAVSGLGYAAAPRYGFNCAIPQFVKDELKIWIDHIQTHGNSGNGGGSGYSCKGDWVNILKTGNLIFQMTFAGISLDAPNMQRALAYIGRNWNDSSQDPGWGNGSTPNCQAMYCTAEGLWYSGINTITVNGSGRDWYADFADAIVNAQQSGGYWTNDPMGGNVLATEWALLTLEMTTSGPLPPPSLELTKVDDVNYGNCVGPGDNITYSICYAANGYGDTNVMITDYLPNEVNYISSVPAGTYNNDTNTVTWNINFPSDACGCVELTVQVKHDAIQGSTITNYCELKGDCVDINAHDTISVCHPIYVDAEANGSNNGTSWQNAYKYLQDALKTAKDFNCNEILVAQGIYWPDINSAHPNGTGNREATFQLLNGVAIYGGFPTGGGAWQGRKPTVYETILSGDLFSNDRQVAEPCDLLNDPNRADNSYHVVTGSDTNETAVLDGFTITGGNANGDSSYNSGGGMYNNSGNPTVRNCKFIRNTAQSGGGMYSGMYTVCYDADTMVINCTFIENLAYGEYGGRGGGIYGSNLIVTNCTFVGNGADYGGGIFADGYNVSIEVTNCTFIENLAYSYYGGQGGGIYNSSYIAMVTNCVFNRNSASGGNYCYDDGYCDYYSGYGGGIFNSGNLTVTNCTFNENLALRGSGGGISIRYPGFVTVTNSILWDNEGGQIDDFYDTSVTYSDIQGGWEGVGNIYKYPMFEADGYHLKMCSPCVDAGTNTPAGGLLPTDIDGEDRIMSGQCAAGGAIVDMGADEYLPDCNALLYAHCRKPACNAIAALYVSEAPDVNLQWSPGRLATSHDVYFGTDYSGVYNATTATPIIYKGRQSATSYLATGLSAGNTYWWRIDEVNDTNIWRGHTYSFRTGLFIDDFERYSDTNDMNANWRTGHSTTCNSESSPRFPHGVLTYVIDGDGKHCNFYYDNIGGNNPFSEVNRPYIGGTVFTNGNEPNMLVVSFKGAINNSADPCYDRMYVALEDTAGNIGVKYNPDPNAALVTAWTQWYIPLNDGDLASVNKAAVSRFFLGFGKRCTTDCYGTTGDGNVMFDNIRLEPPYTPQSRQLTADFTCDCIVNFADFAIMAQEWLTKGIKANIYPIGNPDNIVDILDLAELAEEWLE